MRLMAGASSLSDFTATWRFLTSEVAQRELIKLTKECDRAQWAVAWVGRPNGNRLLREAVENAPKFRRLIVGTHLYQSHPEGLTQLAQIPRARAMEPVGQLFHPKVYMFNFGARCVVVIGSHNLTHHAMERNVEASALIECDAHDPLAVDLEAFFKDVERRAVDIDGDFMFSYRRQWLDKRAAADSLKKFVGLRPSRRPETGKSPQEWDWRRFSRLVSEQKAPSLSQRLMVLAGARRLFAQDGSLLKMNPRDRKKIAGTLGPAKNLEEGADWGLFGSMAVSRAFKSKIMGDCRGLSKALDAIPRTGLVSRQQFEDYVDLYQKAMQLPNARRPEGVSTATRLLAMKRPDTFVCLSNANRAELCEEFGHAPSTTRLSNYWERIVEPMRASLWWNAPEPSVGSERDIWRGRAALLDAIYYDGA